MGSEILHFVQNDKHKINGSLILCFALCVSKLPHTR